MDSLRALWVQAIGYLARFDAAQTTEGRLLIALYLVGVSLVLGFVIGYGIRAGISRRRRVRIARGW